MRTASLAYAMEQIRNAPQLQSIRKPLNELWEHSVKMAAMAFVAAKRWSKVSPDQALLAGLMHGVGKVYILARSAEFPGLFADPVRYDQIVNDWNAAIAKAVLESWEISPAIIEAIGGFEDLDRAVAEQPDLTDMLTIADHLVALQDDAVVMELRLAEAIKARRLGITRDSWKKVLAETADELASLHAALGG